MWNNGNRPGQGEDNPNGEAGTPTNRLQAAQQAMAGGYPAGTGVEAASYFDAFGNPLPLTAIPLSYAVPHPTTVEQLHQRQQALLSQQQALHQQQEFHQREYARQQLQRQQEEAIAAHLAGAAAQQHQQHQQQSSPPDAFTAETETRSALTAQDSTAASAESTSKSPPAPPARGKPEVLAASLAAARIRKEQQEKAGTASDEEVVVKAVPEESILATATAETPKKKPSASKRKKPASSNRKRTPTGSHSSGPSMDDDVPDITKVEYENLEVLMEMFCRVPLLSEFSRPVSLLHPELMNVYAKLVAHPIDLGQVCRGIRRREYKNTRAVRLDMWRIFANCIKYHTHPSNKDNAVPSFVSIALHLREYFNALWQEYMMESDPPPPAPTSHKQHKGSPEAQKRIAYEKRQEDRKKRIASAGATIMSFRCMQKTVASIRQFIANGGLVDKLDTERILGDDVEEDDGGDLDAVVDRLLDLSRRLEKMAESEEDYTVEELDRDMKRCYSVDVFENSPGLRARVGHRIERFLGQIIVPIYEIGCRGVNQSSIWGCMAAGIWARESSKKPFWPALVLGIMAPADQSEEWHKSLTQRNEARLPFKLQSDLLAGKRKAEQAIRRQNTGSGEQSSFFLVEFMGTHEFIWVKESDIIENFDPDSDPNLHTGSKKKRSSRSTDVSGTKMFLSALEEGRWALDEFEMQLNDTCGDLVEEEEEQEGEEEMNYSYAVLCQSDDEADLEEEKGFVDRDEMTLSDLDEANELLASDGLLDFTAEGRKNAKKRAAARKKKIAEEEKSAHKKKGKSKQGKSDSKKVVSKSKGAVKHRKESSRDSKREKRDLEKRRKKRSREREKLLKDESRRKRRRSESEDDPHPKANEDAIVDKRGRATAIVRRYLLRIANTEDIKTIGIGGAQAIPASALDSSGLLGMALAFRAAAGHINYPESSDQAPKIRPWEYVDTEGPKTAAERKQNLEKKASLLEAEIRRARAATEERNRLIALAIQKKQDTEEEIIETDKAAREVIQSRAKKKPKHTPKSKAAPDEAKSTGEEQAPQEGETIEGTVVEADTVVSQEGETEEADTKESEIVEEEKPKTEEVEAVGSTSPPAGADNKMEAESGGSSQG